MSKEQAVPTMSTQTLLFPLLFPLLYIWDLMNATLPEYATETPPPLLPAVFPLMVHDEMVMVAPWIATPPPA